MRILVVDDTEDTREVIGAMARWLGHDVIEARSGMEAVKLAFEKRPELVLMDFLMPEIDGVRAAGALRQIASFTRLPIVIITAYPEKMVNNPVVYGMASSENP